MAYNDFDNDFVLPVEYTEQYIYQYVGYVKKTSKGSLNGGCPLCNEGKSWGRKSRFHYDPDYEGEGTTCKCWNCGINMTSMKFIMTITGMTFNEIKEECQDYDVIPRDYSKAMNQEVRKAFVPSTLPQNSINLSDPVQVAFYKDEVVVQIALNYIKERKLDVAVNRPKAFYVSLEDYTHKNRLIIPYYSYGKIIWYQTRKLLDDDSEKYLSKGGAPRSLYNIDDIDPDIPYIFIFEGAIDSMFVLNGTCVSGISESNKDNIFAELQLEQLRRYPFHRKVYIIDDPEHDLAAKVKTEMLIKRGELVFIWPKKFSKAFKDFNEMAVGLNKTKIPHKFIMGNLYKDDLRSQIMSNLGV
jgi:hypothetical protein